MFKHPTFSILKRKMSQDENSCSACGFYFQKEHLQNSICILCQNPEIKSAKIVCDCEQDLTDIVHNNVNICCRQIVFKLMKEKSDLLGLVSKLTIERDMLALNCERLEQENGEFEREKSAKEKKKKEQEELRIKFNSKEYQDMATRRLKEEREMMETERLKIIRELELKKKEVERQGCKNCGFVSSSLWDGLCNNCK